MSTRISLCMIVKNEAGNLHRCLNSVSGTVDEIIIIDTGSTDDTCQIAKKFGALVHRFPWNDNFSDARNASLEQATGDWILFLDADEELAGESRDALLKLTANEAVEGYFVKIINYLGHEGWLETCPDLVFRLFRNRSEYRFRGAIHEQIADVILEKNSRAVYQAAEDVVILHYGYLDRQLEEKDKKNRNLSILHKEMGQNPQNKLLRFHYGVELFRAERYAEAAGEFTLVANGIDPNTVYFPKLMRYLVLSHQSARQVEKALEAARKGLQFFPNYADLHFYSGLLYLELKQYAKARESLQKAVSMPEQPAYYASFNGVKGFRAYYYLGQIAETFLNYEEALKQYIQALRDNQFFMPALERIVHILKPRENPDYTRESLEKVFEFCTPQANQMMAGIYFREGAYQLALEYLKKIAASGAVGPELQLWKAICLVQEKRYLEALRILNDFQAGSKLYPLVKLNELFCFWVQGNKKKTRTIFLELSSLGLAEDTEKVLSLMAYAPGKQKQAIKMILGKVGMVLLQDLIKRLLDLGEISKALQLLNGVNPKSLTGHELALARCFYDYGYRENAEVLLQDYLAGAQDGEAYFLLAEIYHESGNYFEAEQFYRRALEINPDEPRYYIRQIDLYDNMRCRVLHEALEKYPGVEVFQKLAQDCQVS